MKAFWSKHNCDNLWAAVAIQLLISKLSNMLTRLNEIIKIISVALVLRKRSDKMRKELEDAAREGASRRSNSPVQLPPELERAGSLSDLTGNAKAAGFFSDSLPKRIHLKFVSHAY